MGYRPSLYAAVRTFYHGEEFILGNTKALTNSFRWNNIILNLPGGDFNLSMARVLKWDELKKQVATDMLIYIDDLCQVIYNT